MSIRYVVVNENTLGYIQRETVPGWFSLGVLAGLVRKGGPDPMNGPVSISNETDNIRDATEQDFKDFRVCSKGHLEDMRRDKLRDSSKKP